MPLRYSAGFDLSPAMVAMLTRQCRRGWWRWDPADRPHLLTFRALERRGLVEARETVPMFPDLPGDLHTTSFLTREGWDEVESLGIRHGWSRAYGSP